MSNLQLQAAVPDTGFAIGNSTPTILSWKVPDDGRNHRYIIISSVYISSTETGGQIYISFTGPSGVEGFQQVSAGGQSTGYDDSQYEPPTIVQSGSTVTIAQGSALTGGAATLWAEIWGS